MTGKVQRTTYRCRHCEKVFGYRQSRGRHEKYKHGGMHNLTNEKVTSPVGPSGKPSVTRICNDHCYHEVDLSNDDAITWLKHPESLSKDVRQFLEDYVGADIQLNWAPLCDRADKRWSDLTRRVDRLLVMGWVGMC